MLAEIFSAYDLIIVLVVVLLVFGGTQLPKLARSLGSASREFKKGVEEGAEPDESPAAGKDTKADTDGSANSKA
jgi:sec-independent protein translocase protein TatA